MKILAWNVNHRSRAKTIPPGVGQALEALAPDVAILTEYVASASHVPFTRALAAFGMSHTRVSLPVPKQNSVLITSRYPLVDGDIRAPAIGPSLPSNVLHVHVPDLGIEVLGVRVPAYNAALRRQCWDWILDIAGAAADRPFVIAGDLNTDAKYTRADCGDRLGRLVDAGFTHAIPAEGSSYWSHNGHGVRIDHAFASKSLTVQTAQYVTHVGEHVLVGKRGAYSDHAAVVVELTQ